MRKYISLFAIFIAVLAAGITAARYYYLPHYAQSQLNEAFAKAGLYINDIEHIEYTNNNIVLHKVKLGADKLNTINKITMSYRPMELLWTGSMSKIALIDTELSAQLDSIKNFKTDWTMEGAAPTPLNILKTLHYAQSIVVENLKLNIYSKYTGSIQLQINGQSKQMQDKAHQLSFNMATHQRSLGFSSKIQGTVEQDGAWNISAEITSGRANIAPLKFSRAHIALNTGGNSAHQFINTAEINIGNVKHSSGESWNDVSGTLEHQPKALTLLLTGQSQTNDKLEFTAAYNIARANILSGTLYSPDFENLAPYLRNNLSLDLPDQMAESLQNTTDIFITYETPISSLHAEEKNIAYSLKVISEGTVNKGIIKIKKDSAKIYSAP